jgi:hypothetical protein
MARANGPPRIKKPNRAAIQDLRRLRISQLLVRHLTQREIHAALEQQQFFNPETKKPWSLGTINADVKAIREEWRDDARQKAFEHFSRILAEIQAVKRKSWADGDMRSVLAALDKEMSLLQLHQAPLFSKRVGYTPEDLSDEDLLAILLDDDLDIDELGIDPSLVIDMPPEWKQIPADADGSNT